MEKYQDLSVESEQLSEQRQQMDEESASLKKQLLALRERHAEGEPYMDQLQKSTESLSREMIGKSDHPCPWLMLVCPIG